MRRGTGALCIVPYCIVLCCTGPTAVGFGAVDVFNVFNVFNVFITVPPQLRSLAPRPTAAGLAHRPAAAGFGTVDVFNVFSVFNSDD